MKRSKDSQPPAALSSLANEAGEGLAVAPFLRGERRQH